MNDPRLDPAEEAACRIFTAQLCRVIRQRTPRGRPLVVDLLKGLAVYRFGVPQGAEPPNIPPADLVSSRSCRRLTTFLQFLREPIATALKAIGPLNAVAATPFLAIQACGLAARLMEQLGIQDPTILDYCRQPPDLETLVRQGMDAAAAVWSSANACAMKVIEGFRHQLAVYANEQNHILALLRLRANTTGAWVDGFTGASERTFTLSLEDFVTSFIAPAFRSVAEDMHRKQPLWEGHYETGMQVLRGICPGLARAMELARHGAQPVGMRLCTGRSRRGVPLDIWFFVYPGAGQLQRGCVFSVNRPHRDFILEAADGGRYYFPPCLLSARFTLLERIPHAEYPVVRQPAGGYNWCHPYTGKLSAGIFAGGKLLHDEDAILHAPSERAVALFPHLQQRTQTPMENNLCLGGQSDTVRLVQEELRSALMQSRRPDVLAAVRALHDVARLGLTRGHQDNKSGPRARLRPGVMPYPLSGRSVDGFLAERTFAFRSHGRPGGSASAVLPPTRRTGAVRRPGTGRRPFPIPRGAPDDAEVARILRCLRAIREARR